MAPFLAHPRLKRQKPCQFQQRLCRLNINNCFTIIFSNFFVSQIHHDLPIRWSIGRVAQNGVTPVKMPTVGEFCLDGFHSRRRVDNFGEANPEPFANHHHLAFSDHRSIGQDIQRITSKPVQLDHRPFIQSQKVTYLDLGLADLDGQGDIDILEKSHILGTDTFSCGGIHGRFGKLGFVRHRPFLSRLAPLFQAGLQIDRGVGTNFAKFTKKGVLTIDLDLDTLANCDREGIADLHVYQLQH